MGTDQRGLLADDEEEEISNKKQKINQINQTEIYVDKVKSTVPLQHTNVATERSKEEAHGEIPFTKEIKLHEKRPLFVNELQNMGTYHSVWEKEAFLVTEESKGFNSNMHKFQEKEPLICIESTSKETSCSMSNVHGDTETSDECDKAKISLIGVRKQKNGKYGAVITDKIRHKQVWLGTFDTIEEASQAYFSKKSEFEKLSQQSNKDNEPKENLDQIQQLEPTVTSLSVGNDQTKDTASVSKINSLEVHKNNWSRKEPESSEATICLMANVNGTGSSNECNTSTSNPKDKVRLLGVRRQKTGRYGAVITDKIRHKKVWLGTFDTIEEASQAYFSKKSEFEKLSQQGDKGNKPKEYLDQIQQLELPTVTSLSVGNDQTKDTASVSKINSLEVHKNNWSGKEPESSEETIHLMANVNGTESSNECNTSTSIPKDKTRLLGVRRQKNGRYGAVITDKIRHKKVWLGTFDTIEEASQAYFSKKSEFEKLSQQSNKDNEPKENLDQIQQLEPTVTSLSVGNDQTKDTASVSKINSLEVHKNNWSRKEPESSEATICLMANVNGTGSSNECNTSTSNPKDKVRLLGVRRQKTGRYGAVITDKIRHKKVWLGTFDTIEEASQAYFSKKSEFEKLSQQGDKGNKPKEYLDQIQQLELPTVTSLSVGNDQTKDTASVSKINSLEVHKNNWSGKEPESSEETIHLMANVNGTESSNECNASTSIPKDKTRLLGVRRQKNGRYGAVITDTTKHKQVWLGTFDTVEEASQAYFSKKSELENAKLNQQRNKENRPKKNCDQIQQPESPIVLADGPTLDTASVGMRNERIDFHRTHIIGVHKSKTAEKEPESSKETSCLMANVHGTESSNECHTTNVGNPKAKRNLPGIRRQKNGKYGAVIRDTTRHKQVWLGTFDTVEQASQAYFSKNSELENEKLNQKGNKEKCDKIQQPEAPVVASLSVANDQTLNAASIGRRNKRIDSYKATTHIVGVHKNKMSGKEPESSKETARPMDNVHAAESCDECNTTKSCDPKAKISLTGIRRQKSGRYGAVIKDRINHKTVWLGTFDTVEEASQAYLSKKSELKNLGRQSNKESKPKKTCDQVEQSNSPIVASLSVANHDQTLNTDQVRRRNKRIDSHKKTHFFRVHKRKDSGKYTSEIRNPISKKRVWLGTFGTAEEAWRAYQSKKIEFQRLVEATRQCGNEQTPTQDEKSEKLVNVKSGNENANCEPKSAGGSEIDVPISNSSNDGTEQRIDSHEIGTAEEAFRAYQFKRFDLQSSKEVELQRDMPTDSSAREKQEGQENNEDLRMGEWVQLPGNRAVKFSLKLGIPIIDNYGSLLGEFSTLDDLSICKTEDGNET